MSSHPSPGYPKRWKGNIFVRQNKNQFHLFPERRQHKIVLKNLYIKIMQLPFVLYCFRIKIVVQTLKKMTQISETSAFSQPSLFQKLHKLTFMVSHRSIQLLQRKGLYFGALRPHQHHFTNTSQSTHVNPRPGRKSSAAQEGRRGIPECLSPQVLDLQLQEPGSPSTAPRVVSSALLEHFFPYMPQTETRTKSGGRWGRHKRFPQFSFLFFIDTELLFVPQFFFFYLREKRVLVLIT